MRKALPLCLLLLTVLACQTVSTTPTTDTTPGASATNTSRPILTAPIEPFVTLTTSSSATQDASTPTLSPTQAIPTSVTISASSTATGNPTISTVESTEVTASVTVEPPSITPTVEPTPTRIAGPITATYEATPLGGGECRGYPCYHSAEIDYTVVRLGGVNIRYGPGIEYAKAGFRVYGEVFHVGCLVQVNNNDWWAGTETCYGPNMANNTYTAVEVGGIEYTKAVIGPAGR